ncbi:MAG: zinc-ribbon domain-containing protein [Planctomycetes bacterium]|nr:zinc-ribbon domain-containing protein [Planctomycetota bacterium]
MPWRHDPDDDEPEFEEEDSSEQADESDVTQPCPECGREIYDDAERCPHCGHYVTREEGSGPGWPLWMKIAAALALAAVGLWLLSWCAAALF